MKKILAIILVLLSNVTSAQERHVPITVKDLTVNFRHLKREEILSDWVWLIGMTKLPIMLTASGNAFVQDTGSGSVSLLDVGSGELREVANSVEEFQSLILNDKDFVANNFDLELFVALRDSGHALKAGQIYGFKQPPILGGKYEISNMEATDIEVHFSLTGQIFEQASKVAPGTPVKSISIE